MKVIFLDHDGVICLAKQWGNRYIKKKTYIEHNGKVDSDNEMPVQYRFDDFDQDAVASLNDILEKTGAEIVISSDWRRWATVEEMGEYYSQQGIIKKPIDYTTHILDKNFKFSGWRTELEETRSYEIIQYLSEHPEITHWVAVDDLNMSERVDEETNEHIWGLKNFVWTPFDTEGISNSIAVDSILNFLK